LKTTSSSHLRLTAVCSFLASFISGLPLSKNYSIYDIESMKIYLSIFSWRMRSSSSARAASCSFFSSSRSALIYKEV
jgi:hypothetical protein